MPRNFIRSNSSLSPQTQAADNNAGAQMSWEDEQDPQNKRKRNSWNQGGQPPDLDEMLAGFIAKIRQWLGGAGGWSDGSNGKQGNRSPFPMLLALAGAGIVIWALLGIYQINQQERAVVLRFGKFLKLVQPGLHWLPPLIDKKTIINTTKFYTWSHKATMLTEDANIVDIKISVQYRIADPVDFVLRVNNPLNGMRLSSESALRHVVGQTNMDDVITTGRARIALDVKQRLQEYIDNYQTGIAIAQVNIDDAQAPQAVREAFDDVVKAKEDKERYINEARGYANAIIPEARGQAKRQVEEASAYRDQIIAEAQGEVARFDQLLKQYRKAPDVTRQRLYIETMQSVMEKTSKVIVDTEGGNNLIYLPLDKLTASSNSQAPGSNSRGKTSTENQQPINDSQITDIVQRVYDRLKANNRRSGGRNR